ncbi:MAG: CBS domain-containing protein, partial [Myxococcota bacterium]
VVDGAPEDTPIRSWYDSKERHVFSRIPIHEPGSADSVTGYVLKDDVLAAIVRDEGAQPLSSLRREILVTHEEDPIPELFSRFLAEREHITLVVDSFGGLAGIVTMEDVIETLLGLEIVDESDRVEDMQQLARRNWEQRARAMGVQLPAPNADALPDPETPAAGSQAVEPDEGDPEPS